MDSKKLNDFTIIKNILIEFITPAFKIIQLKDAIGYKLQTPGLPVEI